MSYLLAQCWVDSGMQPAGGLIWLIGREEADPSCQMSLPCAYDYTVTPFRTSTETFLYSYHGISGRLHHMSQLKWWQDYYILELRTPRLWLVRHVYRASPHGIHCLWDVFHHYSGLPWLTFLPCGLCTCWARYLTSPINCHACARRLSYTYAYAHNNYTLNKIPKWNQKQQICYNNKKYTGHY